MSRGLCFKVPKLKEEQRILPTFTVDDIKKLSRHR
jgi:hypothetical protein